MSTKNATESPSLYLGRLISIHPYLGFGALAANHEHSGQLGRGYPHVL